MDCLSATLTYLSFLSLEGRGAVSGYYRSTIWERSIILWAGVMMEMITGGLTCSGFISRHAQNHPSGVFYQLFKDEIIFRKDTRNYLYEEIRLHLLDKPNRQTYTKCKDGHGVKNTWRVSFQKCHTSIWGKKKNIWKTTFPKCISSFTHNITLDSKVFLSGLIYIRWHCFHMVYASFLEQSSSNICIYWYTLYILFLLYI